MSMRTSQDRYSACGELQNCSAAKARYRQYQTFSTNDGYRERATAAPSAKDANLNWASVTFRWDRLYTVN